MTSGRHPRISAVLSLLVALAMTLGGVPAPVLAEAAVELVALDEEPAANKEAEDANGTTSVEGPTAQGESSAQGEPTAQGESSAQGEPAAQGESSAQGEPAAQGESSAQGEPAAQGGSQSIGTQEADPASTPESVGETGEPTEELVDEVEGQTIGVDQGGASNDELLAGYVQRMIDESLPEEAQPAAFLQMRSAKERLSGAELALYNKLKGLAQGVAAGNSRNAVVTMRFSEFGVNVGPWHAGDLEGISSINLNNQGSRKAAARQAFAQVVDTGAVINALLADCPYDLYWYDKEEGMGYSYEFTSGSDSGGPYVDFSGCEATFSMYVAQDYSASGTSGTTQAKENILSAVSTAIQNARRIVSGNAGKSAQNKLVAYREAICDYASYNDDAANNDPPYGNPWQLVWVFDGNTNTNVVCEGYAKAFKYLCDLTWTGGDPDVECLQVTGTLDGGKGSGGHMWNVVCMDDGCNYLVDVTNCDEGTVGAPDKLFMATCSSGSYAGGYAFDVGNGRSVYYAYDDDTKAAFGEEALRIVARAFPDVPSNAWYAGVVARAAGLGLLNGYSNGNFGPNDRITRGQVAVVLWNMAGRPAAGSGARSFPDVGSGAYYYRAVRWASSKGVVSGYASGKYGPNDNVTREQLAVMLANYAKNVAGRQASGSAADFASMSDRGKVSSWAVPSVGWCFKNKILSGSNGKILPQGSATRAEAAKMVVVLYDLLA